MPEYAVSTLTVTQTYSGGSTGTDTALVYPLTTVWTPGAGCGAVVRFGRTGDCAPPDYSSVWYNGGYYSPGICPSGYTVDCSAWDPKFSSFTQDYSDPHLSPKSDETAMMCVPSGFKCFSTFSPWAVSYTTIDNGTSTVTSVRSSAPAFEIRWKKEDLAFLATHPLVPGETDPANVPDIVVANDSKGGLSGGAIAGIVIGVLAVVALIGVAMFFLLRRRKGRSTRPKMFEQPTHVNTGPQLLGQAAIPVQHATASGYQNPTMYPSNPGGQMMQVPVQYPPAVWNQPSQPNQQAEVIGQTKAGQVPVYGMATEVQPTPCAELSAATPKPVVAELSSAHDHVAPSEISAENTMRTPPPAPASDAMSVTNTMQNSPSMGQATKATNTGSGEQVTNVSASEVAELQRRQAELQARRRTLLELQQIEEEEARIQSRLQAIGSNNP